MHRVEHVKPNFPADAFAGTAAYYVRYRVPYPEALLTDLVNRSGVTREGRLLDLACGPGRLTLALIPSFREAWAIDLEPEMIDAARREATRKVVNNVKWMVGRCEDLEAPPASFELITAGEAFHRLDQQLMAARAFGWLKPGCCVATMGCFSILGGKEPWQLVVADALRRWTGRDFKEVGPGVRTPGIGPEHDEGVLREAGFAEVGSHPFVEPHAWTIETILGYLYSTSVCSKAVLGGNAESFESQLKAELHAHDPRGVFRENIQWGYTIGRKPRS